MRQERLDRWLGPALIAIAAIWLWLAFEFIPGPRGPGEPGPRAFPVLLGGVLMILGTLITSAAFRDRQRAPAMEIAPVTRREAGFALGVFALLIAYGFFLERLGFLTATPLAVLALLRGLLGVRAWGTNLATAGGITGVCWLVFVVLLEAPLPRGTWWWLL